MSGKFWEIKRMQDFSKEEWEALCDGCGVCCMEKLRNEENEIFYTCVACDLFEVQKCRCKNYANRSNIEKECLKISPEDPKIMQWLPVTCAYRRLYESKPLPDWHYLVCGDKEAVHDAGFSARRPSEELCLHDKIDSVIIGEIEEKIDGTFLKKVVLQTKDVKFLTWLEKIEG